MLLYSGSPTWTRTRDLRINSPSLYQLSYQGIEARIIAAQFAFAQPKEQLFSPTMADQHHRVNGGLRHGADRAVISAAPQGVDRVARPKLSVLLAVATN